MPSAEEGSQPLLRSDWISTHSIGAFQSNLHGRGTTPSLQLVVGTDGRSAGMAAVALLPTGGRWHTTQALVTARWSDHPQTVEECVRIAIRGLRAYLEEAGLPPE